MDTIWSGPHYRTVAVARPVPPPPAYGPTRMVVPPPGVPSFAGPVGPRPPMRWGWLVVGLLVAVLVVVGLASVAASRATITVTGTATIQMYGATAIGGSCAQPLAQGMPVSVYDATGALVGTTSLSGSGVARATWTSSYYAYADSCEYSFTVPGVGTGSSHYRIKLGSAPGDGVGFTLDQLRGGPVGLTYR